MRKLAGLFICLLVLFLCPGSSFAGTGASDGFSRLKSLVGDWDGKTESGKVVRASYKLVSAGTTLVETLQPPDESEMVTAYHLDGDSVAVTHYCSANNQPRMRAGAIQVPVKQLDFGFLDATNLASSDAGHMHRLVVIFDDQDHFTQKWTWREKGHEATEVFHFSRKK